MNYAGKVREIFSSQALRAIYRWSKPVRSDVLLIALLGVSGSLISLAVAMITKHLIDGATGGRAEALWKYGTALVLLIVIQRLFSVLMSRLRLKASVRFQRHMQQTVIGEIMDKMPGWERLPKVAKTRDYGAQRCWQCRSDENGTGIAEVFIN